MKTPKIDFSAGETSIVHDATSVSKNVRFQMETRKATIKGTVPELKFQDEINGPTTKNIILKSLEMSDPKIEMQLNNLVKNSGSNEIGKDLVIENLLVQRPNFVITILDSANTTTLKSSGKIFGVESFKSSKTESGKKRLNLLGVNFDLTNIQFDNGNGTSFKSGEINVDIPLLTKLPGEKPRIKLKSLLAVGSGYVSLHGTDTLTANNKVIQISNLPELQITKKDIIKEFLRIPGMEMGKTNFSHHTQNKMIDIVGLSMNARQEYFEMDSFSFINRIPRDSFWLQQPFEKDYLTFKSGMVRMFGLKPIIKNGDTVVYARKISFNPMNFKVERDKRRPNDTISYRPLLANSLMKIPFPIEIDSLELKHSMIWHNVIDAKTEKEGTIFFSDLDALVRNIRNYEIKDDDTLRLRANAKLMGSAPLYVRFRQGYKDSLQTFLLSARMGSMEMKDLNSILTPLANARADQGIIDSLWMEVMGNDYFAFGKITLDYRHLKIALLNKAEKRRNFISWLANIVVRTNNSKEGNIYEERLRNKSIFNYWAKISLKGLLTSLGVVSNKKQLKKYNRSLKEKNLPPDFPDE